MELADMLRRAGADEPVYLTDVRRAFLSSGGSLLHIHQVLYEGGTERFAICLPEWKNAEERDFVKSYLCAEIYNRLCALGALEMILFCDTGCAEVWELIRQLPEIFQTERDLSGRSGYGKCLNVNERILRQLRGKDAKFRFVFRDLREEPDTDAAATVFPKAGSAEPDFWRKIPERASRGCRLGIDVGGSDIKFAVAKEGHLISFLEYDWDPASFREAEELICPILSGAEALLRECGEPDGFDAIGLSFPDVVIRGRIAGGETTKTRGIREHAADYEAEFAAVSGLTELLKGCTKSGVVRCINDGPMAAFTAAVESASAGGSYENGFFAWSLGTELGTGWVLADGSVPDIPLEIYNLIIDLGSFGQKKFAPDDIRSTLNLNTGLAGTLQKYTGQSGVFRLAAKLLPEKNPELLKRAEEEGLFVREGGRLLVPTAPSDRRKECLSLFAESTEEGVPGIFRQIGEYLAVCSRECRHLLHIETNERTLFGRLVKNERAAGWILEGASAGDPDTVWRTAQDGLAASPLMRELAADRRHSAAQFGQAVGAVYYSACRT